jgi:hypothetical protein
LDTLQVALPYERKKFLTSSSNSTSCPARWMQLETARVTMRAD